MITLRKIRRPRVAPLVLPTPTMYGQADVTQYLRSIGRTNRPVIAGPWVSEIGFELLYWIPFLRWAVETELLRPERLWIVSRGGCRSWYAGLTSRYLELYTFRTPEQLRAGNVRRMAEQASRATTYGLRRNHYSTKQFVCTQWETDLALRAARAGGLEAPILLHPSIMYRAFRTMWQYFKHDPMPRFDGMTRARRLEPPPALEGLPSAYVAVKWYTSAACPDTELARARVARLLEGLTRTSEIVLLHTGVQYDDHGELPIPADPRVHAIALDPVTNLDVQTAVIARASRFVGTYGGFAYLAPFLGVPTLGLHDVKNFRTDHLEIMRTVARRNLRTPFHVRSLEAAALECDRSIDAA